MRCYLLISQKRMRIAATCARVALSCGFSLPLEPLTCPLHCVCSVAVYACGIGEAVELTVCLRRTGVAIQHGNELLTELYQIETAPNGWDIAGGLLDLASSLLDGLNEEQDDSESNQSAQQLPTESEPLALSDGNEALDVDDAQEYIKAVLLQINDVLECDKDAKAPRRTARPVV